MYLFTYPRKKIREAPLIRGTFFLNDITAVMVGKGSYIIYIVWVQLMCALMTNIKLFIFRNIFLGIEKAIITFSILEKIFPKNGN